MSISDARAIFALSASGTNSRTQVSGSAIIGKGQTNVALAIADIAYSFSITSTGAANVATLNLTNGTVALTTGTPTVSDSGKDFEGKTIEDAAYVYAVFIEAVTVVTSCVVTSSSNFLPDIHLETGAKSLTLKDAGTIGSVGTIAFTFGAAGCVLNVTVIAKKEIPDAWI